MESIKTSLTKSLPQNYEDYSEVIYELKTELYKLNESFYGRRVEKWCEKAGYISVHYLDLKGLQGLLNAVKRINQDNNE